MENKNRKILCDCSNCGTIVYEDDRHIRILKGDTYQDFYAEDDDIRIYQCPNCKNKIYA